MMKNTPFPLFQAAFPPAETRVAFDAAQHETWADKVPPALAAEWRSTGFGAYGGGLLWTPVPDKPILNPDDWDVLDGTGVEVLRTAFASVCLWQGGQFLWLNVHTGKVTPFYPSAEILFDAVVPEQHFRKQVLLESLYQQARVRHGALGPDECFGFAPLPGFGGATSEEYLIKTTMRGYVAMLAQMLTHGEL